ASGIAGGITQRGIETGSVSQTLSPKAIAVDAALGAGGAVAAKAAAVVAPKVAGAVKSALARGRAAGAGARAARGGGLAVQTGIRAGASGGINVGAKGLAHVLERHFPSGAKTAGKSLFGAGEDIASLSKAAEGISPTLQAGGNFERTVNAG